MRQIHSQKYMLDFFEAMPDRECVQCTIAQIQWRSNITLPNRCVEAEVVNRKAVRPMATSTGNFAEVEV